jgi:hypothetical protein
VTLTADQWKLVATIGGGKSAADVLKTQGFGEFEGCKAVKELVDLRLVHVDSSDVPPAQQLLTPAAERSSEAVSDYNAEHNFEYSDQTSDHASGNGSDHNSRPSDHASDNGSDHSADLSGTSGGTVAWDGAAQGTAQADEVADLSEVWHEDDAQLPVEAEEPVEEVVAPAPEPVNRGLLLKFLGSARN